MGLRDLVMGRPACAAPGSSSSSSSNALSSFVDAFLGHGPKSELKHELSSTAVILKASFDLLKAAPLSTIPGDENETELTDFVNGHHGYTCGENSETSILCAPELSRSKPQFQKSAQIDSVTRMKFMPKFDGPPEMDVPHAFHQSLFQQYDDLTHQSKECLQELVNTSIHYIDVCYDNEIGQPPQMGLDRLGVSIDEFSGGWLSLLGIALSHLSGLSQPRFLDEPIKYYEQEMGRVWIKIEGLQERSGWSIIVEATCKTLSDALQDAAMLAVITLRMHFPVEFRGTPFMVLPMRPGQRSELDYPAIGSGGAEAAAFMGISYDDVVTLHWQRFTSLRRERRECDEALEEKYLEKLQWLAAAKNMVEELPPTQENNQRILDILLKMDNKVADSFVLPDCGWSVSVSDKMQKADPPSDQEEIPPASSPAVSVRARL